MRTLLSTLTSSLTLAAAAGIALAGPAAAAESVTQHISIAATGSGAVITCGPLTLTPLSGTLDGVFHENADSHGNYHYSGTNVAHGVTLADPAGEAYRLQGTSSFSGTSTDAEGDDNRIFTTAVTFVVLGPTGGRVGSVHFVEHLSPGRDARLDSGQCTGTGGEG
jgi:hypothetical protein